MLVAVLGFYFVFCLCKEHNGNKCSMLIKGLLNIFVAKTTLRLQSVTSSLNLNDEYFLIISEITVLLNNMNI